MTIQCVCGKQCEEVVGNYLFRSPFLGDFWAKDIKFERCPDFSFSHKTDEVLVHNSYITCFEANRLEKQHNDELRRRIDRLPIGDFIDASSVRTIVRDFDFTRHSHKAFVIRKRIGDIWLYYVPSISLFAETRDGRGDGKFLPEID